MDLSLCLPVSLQINSIINFQETSLFSPLAAAGTQPGPAHWLAGLSLALAAQRLAVTVASRSVGTLQLEVAT